jgi:hypothetical protein
MSFRMRRGRASFSLSRRGPRASYRLGCLVPVAVAVTIALAACSGAPAPLVPQSTPSAEQLAAEVLCSGSTFTRCVEDVVLATTMDPGGLAAICEYGQGEGDVVLLDSKDEAATQCATNSDASSKVFKVITIPGTPPPTQAPTPKPLAISKVSLTNKVSRGSTAKVTVKTAPKAKCSIDVEYDSGPSTAAGLGDKTAGSSGKVSWSWTVGRNTARGSYPITIYCTKGDAAGTLSLTFKVT